MLQILERVTRHRLPPGRVGVPARLRGHERGLPAAGGQRARAAARTRDGLRAGRRRRARLGAASARAARTPRGVRRLAAAACCSTACACGREAARRRTSRAAEDSLGALRRGPRGERARAGFPAPEAGAGGARRRGGIRCASCAATRAKPPRCASAVEQAAKLLGRDPGARAGRARPGRARAHRTRDLRGRSRFREGGAACRQSVPTRRARRASGGIPQRAGRRRGSARARARACARGCVGGASPPCARCSDAAALASSGLPADASRAAGSARAVARESSPSGLAPDSDAVSAPLLTALADALDAEIARWEERAARRRRRPRRAARVPRRARVALGVRRAPSERAPEPPPTLRRRGPGEARARRAGRRRPASSASPCRADPSRRAELGCGRCSGSAAPRGSHPHDRPDQALREPQALQHRDAAATSRSRASPS